MASSFSQRKNLHWSLPNRWHLKTQLHRLAGLRCEEEQHTFSPFMGICFCYKPPRISVPESVYRCRCGREFSRQTDMQRSSIPHFIHNIWTHVSTVMRHIDARTVTSSTCIRTDDVTPRKRLHVTRMPNLIIHAPRGIWGKYHWAKHAMARLASNDQASGVNTMKNKLKVQL